MVSKITSGERLTRMERLLVYSFRNDETVLLQSDSLKDY